MIDNFNDWDALNEASVTSEQAEKVLADAEKWSKEAGIEIDTEASGIRGWGSVYVWVSGIFGLWKLELEKATRKSRQDSMYRQTYDTGSDKKWYITFPGRWSQYESRARTKPGNLKSFKSIIEEFSEVKKVFDKISFFFENVLGIPGIDTTRHENREGKEVVHIEGKNLKLLNARLTGSLVYSRENGWQTVNVQYKRTDKSVDPTKVEILFTVLSSSNYSGKKYEKALKESGKNLEDVVEVLETLKDYSLDKFLEETKGLDWEEVKKKYIGRLSGKKYGI